MTGGRRARHGLRAGLVATAATLLLGTLGPAASAHDVSRAVPARSACTPGTGHRGSQASARLDRARDAQRYTLRQLRRIDRRLHRRLTARALDDARLGLVLRIPVHVHVIDGTRSRGPSLRRVRRQLAVLNDAFAGGESAHSAPTRFRFYLDSFDRVRNQRWRTASITDAADRELRRALHTGGPEDLNLYFSAPAALPGGGVVLGWSRMPWQAVRHPLLDGVTINQGSMPGGALRGYARGDTTVHEVGHWLGLFHTFEGGCSRLNDLVDDTPAEGQPSLRCEVGRDTCAAPGLDPVHNFMDYSFDACMTTFTPGQVSRMTDSWLAYRTP